MDNLDAAYKRIISAIGPERYRSTALEAQETAPHSGDREGIGLNSEVPHEINDLLWDSGLSDLDKVRLMFRVYRDMPCYALLMGLSIHYGDLAPEARAEFLEQAHTILSSPDTALAAPLAYSLWCDFFEDSRRVKRVWKALVDRNANAYLLERVLDVSGPVPFPLKESLYDRLLADKMWHPAIYRSLLYSNFDGYGQIDKAKAHRLLSRLDIPANTEGLADLQADLSEHTQAIGA